MAFDEEPALGIRCRRWRFATVIYSQPAKKECVRVHLENGDAVICTVDHPWLADRVDSNGGGARRDWVCADRLLEHAPFVLRAVQPWESATTYEAGWLAGMFDGEGSICSSGTTRGVSWNLSLAQKEEILADRVVEVLARFGFSIGVHGRREDGMRHISVLGGVPSALAVLGTFRSLRLLRNFTKLDRQEMPSVRRHGRSRMKVTAVEPIGLHDVQSIGTSTGTYIGEGYLMHNSSGYERLYKKMDAVFDWPKPEYQLFTEERFALLIRIMQEKRVWLISKDATISSLEPYQIGLVQTGVRSKPVYVYSNQDHSTLTQPHQRLDQVPYPRVQDAIAGPLTIIPLTQGQLNTLRSEYLSPMIAPGMADRAYGVLAADHLVGAIAFSNPNRNVGDWLDVYMMSDFAVMSPIQRLSKLVLAAALSTEIGVLLEERYCCRVESIGTTAFTDKPISMKYRGLFELHSRKEGQLNYVARAGRWTLKEAFAWWTKTQSLTSTP